MLGTEPEVLVKFVETGQLKLVFWPMLDHGDASLNSHAAADCIGQQSPDAFWQIHDQFFAEQEELWGADRDYFVQAAVNVGVDQATFESCYDSGEAHLRVTEQDRLRRERGIFNRPTFEINGQFLIGSQSFAVFEQFIQAAIP